MVDSIVQFPSGSFRLSRIVYITDLQLAGARAIPLGAIAEISLPHARGLALSARTELEDVDLQAIGALMRDHLAAPFEYLEQEFRRAWTESPKGGALDMLMGEHASSLSILVPRQLDVPKRWLIEKSSSLESLVRPRLTGEVEEEFFNMILEDLFGETGLPDDGEWPSHKEGIDRFAA